jgi:hypothetical protein
MRPADEVKHSILDSLDREASSPKQRWWQALLYAALFYAVMGEGLGRLLFGEIPSSWRVIQMIWALVFLWAKHEVSRPQPRLEVPAFWSSRVFAKLAMVAIAVLTLQTVVCPHFLFSATSTTSFFGVFGHIKHFYMDHFGMTGCLLLCGFTVGVLGIALSIWVIRKTLSFRKKRSWIFCGVMVSFLSLPLVFLPKADGAHEFQAFYWIIGLLLGVFSAFSLATLLKEFMASAKPTNQPQ